MKIPPFLKDNIEKALKLKAEADSFNNPSLSDLKGLSPDELKSLIGDSKVYSGYWNKMANDMINSDISREQLTDALRLYYGTEAVDNILEETLNIGGKVPLYKIFKNIIKIADNKGPGDTTKDITELTLDEGASHLAEKILGKGVGSPAYTGAKVGDNLTNMWNADEVADEIFDLRDSVVESLRRGAMNKQLQYEAVKIEWNLRDLGPFPDSKYVEMDLGSIIEDIRKGIQGVKSNIAIIAK